MTKSLTKLLKASGKPAIINSRFGDVTPTPPPAYSGMTSYLVGAPGSYSGVPTLPGEAADYTTPQTFNIGVTFSGYGSNFSYIRRNGTAPWTAIGSANQVLNSVTWDDGLATATLNVTVTGNYDATTYPTLLSSPNGFVCWFTGYTSPTQNPNVGYVSVTMFPQATGGGTATGTNDFTLQWTYNPDTGGFNPNQTTASHPFRIQKAAYPSWSTTYEWELHTDSNYNNLLGTNTYSFQSDVMFDADVGYVRYRIRAEYNGGTPGSWTNYGVVHWTDPRADQ